jgi:hypothetical protein
MVINSLYYFNDTFAPGFDPAGITNKFQHLMNSGAGYLNLQLQYLRVNRRVVRRSEYNVSSANLPLTALRVGAGGEPATVSTSLSATPDITQLNPGYDNYTKFINRILKRHGIFSRFYPMGPNYVPPGPPLGQAFTFDSATHNLIGCNLSILEDFALTFLETPSTDMVNQITGMQAAIYHIETVSPMSLKGYIQQFNSVKEYNILSSPYNSGQITLDQVSFITDRRYNPSGPQL